MALFRAGSDDAFRAIHDRYRARLLAYARQMLHGALGDPEDALQDVFLRAYRALRASDRPVTLRAWLYRIAHNRCIDELRRPCPLPSELAADAEPAFSAPAASGEAPAVAERSAALARLVADVQTLPEQQRSALLMRELQGLSYAELGSALGVSVPAIKSLLLRARTGLIDISVARETPCGEIREELLAAADRSVRISGRARRHCGECTGCDTYRGELKRVRRGFASLTPSGPLGQLGMLFGIGGGGGAAAAGGSAAGGGAAAAGGSAIAAKIAVAVCCAALIGTAGRAVIAPGATPAKTSAAPAPLAHAAAASPTTIQKLPAAQPPARSAAHSSSPPGAAAPGTPGAGPTGGTLVGTGPVGGTGSVGGIGSAGTISPVGGVGGSAASTGASGSTGTTGATGASAGATPPSAVNGIGAPGQGSAALSGDGAPSGASGAIGPTGATAPADPRPPHSGADGGTSSPY